jgi:lipopolysaccharide export system permease protein
MRPKRYFRYIAWHYGKNFLILLAGLSLAVVFIDFLQYAHRINGGVNRKILYAFYTWEHILLLIYPLVLLMALAWTQIGFIYRNVFVSFFSFGYRRERLLLPFLVVALLVYSAFVALQTTSFAHGRDRARVIIKKSKERQKLDDLFFRYGKSFVFVKLLDPLRKELHGGMVFRMDDGKVVETIRFPLARFTHGKWVAPRALIRKKRFSADGKLEGFRDRSVENLTILKGYRPRIFKQIYEGKSLTLGDALAAWRLLARQGLSADKVKATVYNMLVMPLFAVALLVILFFKTPPYHRFTRKEKLWTLFLGNSLLAWAILFALYRLSINGVIDPDYGQTVPVLLLAAYALHLYFSERRKERPVGVSE